MLWTRAVEAALAQGDDVLIAVSPMVAAHPRVELCRLGGARLHARAEFTLQRGLRQRWHQRVQRMLRKPASLLAALDSFRPDHVVLCQGGVFDFLVETGLNEWLAESGCPFSLVCQSNDERDALSPDYQVAAQDVLARAHGVFFVSTHNRDHAARQIGSSLPRSTVLNNPVELSSERRSLPWPEGSTPRIAVLARLESGPKGLDVLLEAVAQTPIEKMWTVSVFGRGPDSSRLQMRSSELGIQGRVSFAGYEPSLERIWASHHGLLVASRREGCALAMLEAMAFGRPVLTTEVGGARDWVEDGVNGFICQSGDAGALARMLWTALSQFEDWPRMGENSSQVMRLRHHPKPEMLLLDSIRP